jgi:hypothetical protein
MGNKAQATTSVDSDDKPGRRRMGRLRTNKDARKRVRPCLEF